MEYLEKKITIKINNLEFEVDFKKTKDSLHIIIDKTTYKAQIQKIGELSFVTIKNKTLPLKITKSFRSKSFNIESFGVNYEAQIQSPKKFTQIRKKKNTGTHTIQSPITGRIVSVKIKVGSIVQENQPLFILEAMKMQNLIRSPVNGKITKIDIVKGQNVNVGHKTLVIKSKS